MIQLSKPYIPKRAFKLVRHVLETGDLIQGKYVSEFERLVEDYLDVPHAKMVSSGTAALHLAMLVLDIRQGDEVIVPAFTYPATANVIELVGGKSVFVDINLTDFCINPDLIEEKITPKTKAIIPVHEFGQAADMDSILEIARKHNLYVIEDAACALGTEYKGKKVGTFGDIGCFSLHPRKAITTGEGGIISTSSAEIAQKVELFRNHGVKKEKGKLDFLVAGLNYRLTDFQAAIGIPQLEKINDLIEQRIKQASFYHSSIGNNQLIKTPKLIEGRKHIYQTYHIILDEWNRDDMIIKLREEGVETNLGAQALHCLTYFKKKYGVSENELPNATIAYKKGLALPIGWHLNERDQSLVIQKLLG